MLRFCKMSVKIRCRLVLEIPLSASITLIIIRRSSSSIVSTMTAFVELLTTSDGLPLLSLSTTCVRPSRKSLRNHLTIVKPIVSLPYASVNALCISHPVLLRKVSIRMYARCSKCVIWPNIPDTLSSSHPDMVYTAKIARLLYMKIFVKLSRISCTNFLTRSECLHLANCTGPLLMGQPSYYIIINLLSVVDVSASQTNDKPKKAANQRVHLPTCSEWIRLWKKLWYAFVSISLCRFSYHILYSCAWELRSIYCIIWSKLVTHLILHICTHVRCF